MRHISVIGGINTPSAMNRREKTLLSMIVPKLIVSKRSPALRRVSRPMTLIDSRSVGIVTDNLLRVSGYVHVVFHGTHVKHTRHTIANLRSDCRVIKNLMQ